MKKQGVIIGIILVVAVVVFVVWYLKNKAASTSSTSTASVLSDVFSSPVSASALASAAPGTGPGGGAVMPNNVSPEDWNSNVGYNASNQLVFLNTGQPISIGTVANDAIDANNQVTTTSTS